MCRACLNFYRIFLIKKTGLSLIGLSKVIGKAGPFKREPESEPEPVKSPKSGSKEPGVMDPEARPF